MFAALQVADEGFNQAIQALTDALSGGDIALAVVAAVLIAGIFALKFFGKKVPFVGAIVDIVLSVTRKFSKKTPPQPGVEAVVEVKKDEKTVAGVRIVKDE
jgi:hypothetical protein